MFAAAFESWPSIPGPAATAPKTAAPKAHICGESDTEISRPVIRVYLHETDFFRQSSCGMQFFTGTFTCSNPSIIFMVPMAVDSNSARYISWASVFKVHQQHPDSSLTSTTGSVPPVQRQQPLSPARVNAADFQESDIIFPPVLFNDGRAIFHER